MRIAGIYPCDVELDVKVQHAVSEPYGLELILAVAKEAGHDVELFMPFKEEDGKVVSISEEEVTERISEYNPDVAAYSMFTCQYPMGKRIAGELKKRNPKIVNVAGNKYATYLALYQRRIDDCFDFSVLNEGELGFRGLLYEIENGREYKKVQGLVINDSGKAVFGAPGGRNFELDKLPDALRFPIILNQCYQGISIPPLSEKPGYAVVESARGCFYECDFCDVPGNYGNKIAFRSPGRVVDELAGLKEKGADIFYFCDLNFTASPKHVLDFCEEIRKRGLDFHWYCMSNIDSIDGKWELLEAMKEAGCYKIAWGIESTNDDALKKMNKGVNDDILYMEQTLRVLEKSAETGIINQGYYIVGFPWETEESMLRDGERLKYVPVHHITIGIFTPIPLSTLHRNMLNEGYVLDSNLERHDRNHLIFNHLGIREDNLKKAQQKIHDDFYESREYLERVSDLCRKEQRLATSFNNYFEFLGKNVRVEV